MIDRYKNEVIDDYWCDNRKYSIWYRIQQAIAESNAEYTGEDLSEWKLINFDESDIAEIKRIEQDTKHDVAAFIKFICEENPKNARFIHSSLTSSDLVDTFNSFAIKRSFEYVISCVETLNNSLNEMSYKYLNVKMLGRTPGQHASITTLGHKLEVYCRQFEHWIDHARMVCSNVKFKLDGPVGMGCNMTEYNSWILSSELDMERFNGSTQVIPRYYYYPVMSDILALSMILTSIATDLRLLNQTEIGEFVIENTENQWGSSSMPHKINPISLEQVCGLSRLIKGYFNAFIENMVLWNERDISNSSVERIVFPDIFHIIVTQIGSMKRSLYTGHFDVVRIKENLMNARIDVISNQLVQIMLSDNNIAYDQAVERVKSLLSKYKGMLIKDIFPNGVSDSCDIEALKELGIIK